MKKRRLLVLVLAAAAAIAGVAGYVLWPSYAPAHRINPGSFWQIQVGMPQAEVEAILGGPPGVYAASGVTLFPIVDRVPLAPGETRRETWLSTDCCVRVAFRDDGTVAGKALGPAVVPVPSPPPWDRVQRWLGL